MKKKNTKDYSWHILVDADLKQRTKTAATVNRKEIREYVSEAIVEKLKNEVEVITPP
jgi:hypothetical protein